MKTIIAAGAFSLTLTLSPSRGEGTAAQQIFRA